MTLTTLEEAFDAATAHGSPSREMAGAVLLAADESGIKYSKSFGQTSLDESAPQISGDTVMWFASCTKLITSIAALQCVERGLVNLDDDIGTILEKWKEPMVITDKLDENGKPVLEPAEKKITLRMLLSHTSGLMYHFTSPVVAKWIEREKYDLAWETADIEKNFGAPLAFQPGTGWGYSPGLDWAGKLIERITGMTLGEFMKENIFDPLGMNDTTFRVSTRPDLEERLMSITCRGVEFAFDPTAPRPAERPALEVLPRGSLPVQLNPKDEHGGSGLFSTPNDYIKLLIAVLKKDSKLLKTETFDRMGESVITNPMQPMPISSVFGSISRAAGVDLLSPHWDQGLFSGILRSDYPGVIRKGSLHWTGAANTSWIVDRESSLVTLFATNHMPYEYPEVVDFQPRFHGQMLESFGKNQEQAR